MHRGRGKGGQSSGQSRAEPCRPKVNVRGKGGQGGAGGARRLPAQCQLRHGGCYFEKFVAAPDCGPAHTLTYRVNGQCGERLRESALAFLHFPFNKSRIGSPPVAVARHRLRQICTPRLVSDAVQVPRARTHTHTRTLMHTHLHMRNLVALGETSVLRRYDRRLSPRGTFAAPARGV